MKEMVTIDLTQEDGELFTRNARVAEDLLAEKVGDSTAKGYASAWTRFRKYCKGARREALPADVDTVVTYLAIVSENGSMASAQMACSSITPFHRKKFLGEASLTESLKVKQLMIAIKRRHGKLVTKRDPVTAEVVRVLF